MCESSQTAQKISGTIEIKKKQKLQDKSAKANEIGTKVMKIKKSNEHYKKSYKNTKKRFEIQTNIVKITQVLRKQQEIIRHVAKIS